MNNINILFNKAKAYISLPSVGTILAIVAPIAYLSGLSFYQGGLSSFGVDADIFPLSTQQIYVNSYYALLFALLKCLSVTIDLANGMNWCSLLIIILTIIAVLIAKWYKMSDVDSQLKRRAVDFMSFFVKHYDHESMKPCLVISGVFSFFSFLIYLLLVVTICLWLPFHTSYLSGKEHAEKRIKNYRDYGCKESKKTESFNRCTIVKDKSGNVLYEGILVAINEKEIAMFDKNGSHIFAKPEGFILQRKLY